MQCTDINFDNLPSSISEFFTPEQFAEISEYEKQLLSNLRQHFEALRYLGLPVTPPEFMLINRSEKERRKPVTPAVIESSDGSDSEFTPALEKPKRTSGNQRKRFQPPRKVSSKDNRKDKVPGRTKRKKQKKKKTDSDDEDEEEEVHVYPFRKMRMSSYMSLFTLDDDDFLCSQRKRFQPPRKASSKDNTKDKVPGRTKRKKQKRKETDSDDEDEEEEVHVYPFRKKRMSSYMSLFTLDDDDFLYCEECRQEYHGDCPVHGPLLCIDDTEVYYGDSYAKDLGIQSPKSGKKLQRTNDLQKSDVNTDSCGVYLELNYDKCHPDLSLGANGLTKVHIKHEQRDVNFLLNDTDIKPTATTQREIIKTCVNTVSVDKIKMAYNFSSQHDYTVENNDNHCISKICTNLTRDDQSDIECIIVKSSSNEDPGEKYNNYDVNKEGFHKTCLQKDGATLTGEKTNNPDDVFTVDVTKICGVKTHKRIHTGEKPYKCDVCNVGFTRSGNLTTHKRIHTGEKPYKCDVCNIGFTRSGHLKRHKRIHMGEKPYKCDVCNVGFTRSGHLKRHKRIHTGEKPYKCDVCNVGFTESDYLKTHRRIHTGEKPYKCDVCNVGFTQSGDLKKHKRIHTGERPYKCDVCNVGFSEKGNLKKHKIIHTGEKPYKCNVCNVGFTRSHHLKAHRRIHTGEKPFNCDVCNVGFIRRDNLKKHKIIHTGEKPYKCDVCNIGFSESGHLKTHKRIHTGKKP